jgi:diamine N-acetyltransferase
MIKIEKADLAHLSLLADLAKTTLIESHAEGAPEDAIAGLIDRAFSDEALKTELLDPANIYHLLYHEGRAVGYSKIRYSAPHPLISIDPVTKLDKLFLLKAAYGLNLGKILFDFNVALSKRRRENGMWLFVWKENYRAVNFYQKNHFEIIGSHDYAYNDTYSRPNHLMLLKF